MFSLNKHVAELRNEIKLPKTDGGVIQLMKSPKLPARALLVIVKKVENQRGKCVAHIRTATVVD